MTRRPAARSHLENAVRVGREHDARSELIEAYNGLGLVAQDEDRLKGTSSTLTTLGLAGKIVPGNSVRLCTTSRSGADPSLPARSLRLEVERDPDDARLLALRAEWRAWDGPRGDELTWQLDLKAVF